MIGRQRLALAGTLMVLGCNSRFLFDEHALGDDGAAPAGGQDDGPGHSEGPGPFEGGGQLNPDAAGDVVAAGPAVCGEQVPGCLCSGTLCSCARQQWCRLPAEFCPDRGPCSLLCHNGTRCEGACRDGCKLECEHGSTCAMTMGEGARAEGESSVLTLTVGANSIVHCENNATCHVTCTGSCTLECQSGARCDLRCPGDSAPRSADSGGSCRW